MQLKTSTSIALKFSAYVMLLLVLFGIGINLGSFTQRYRVESNRVEMGIKKVPRQGKFLPQPKEELIIIPYSDDAEQELIEHRVWRGISKIDDEFIIYGRGPANTIRISNISHLIDMQQELFMTSLLVICCGGLLTFIVSRVFIRSSFTKINELVSFVQDIDIHNLHKTVPLSGPEDDEIRIIAQSLQSSLDTIKTQTDSLKDFVSYASHELKTPLATLRGLVDLGIKKNDIETTGPKIKKTLTEMNELLDSLVQITKREFASIHHEQTDIVPLIKSISENISKQFEKKSITLTISTPDNHTVLGKSEIISIIISNLLHNAYKFTPEHGSITLSLQGHILKISDTGKGIAPEDQSKIRTRFRKKNSESTEGYGLGLYMVKLLVEKLGRSLSCHSIINQGTSFIIHLQ